MLLSQVSELSLWPLLKKPARGTVTSEWYHASTRKGLLWRRGKKHSLG